MCPDGQRTVAAGKEILEGCPAGQQEAARKSLQEQSVPVITEALVTRVGLTESQHASTSQPARKDITLKTPTTNKQACRARCCLSSRQRPVNIALSVCPPAGSVHLWLCGVQDLHTSMQACLLTLCLAGV